MTTNIIRLVDSRSLPQSTTWVALSYCWGGDQPVQTKKENLAQHYAGIAVNSIPKTLRDATFITQHLGHNYLWIDCLCICQNDDGDRDREILKMPDIYQGAIFTISAARARSCDIGFLHNKDSFSPSVLLPASFITNGDGFAQLADNQDIYFKKTLLEPIQKRAWAFQETLLSKRLLRFGTLDTSWDCAEHLLRSRGLGSERSAIALKNSQLAGGEALSESKVSQKWISLVEQYCGRDMKCATDKLVTISAVASAFARLNNYANADYLAGHWKQGLFHSLLWEVAGSESIRRPREYIAPSWSWAFIQNALVWLGGDWPKLEKSYAPRLISAEMRQRL